MTDADRYRRVCEIFTECLDLPADQRRALIRQRAGNDTSLRDELEAMLARDAMDVDDAFGEAALARAHEAVNKLVENADAPADSKQSAITLPERIGQYSVRRVIGRGGMGVVYEAEQINPHRPVAVKVLRAEMDSPHAKRRFRREAQVLAALQHPGIAHIYDAGSTTVDHEERPFLAMEYIDGPSIDAFVREHRLPVPEVLLLAARVCDALHHAHQRGVIHRDLKPANILVAEHATVDVTAANAPDSVDGGCGQPKILDFGVARLTAADTEVEEETLRTQAGQLIGTVAYMSPEQLQGETTDLDIRCDVYAMGVVLYQLLCGRLPVDVAGRSIAESVRAIVEVQPVLLGAIDQRLRGDVETIVAKAMDKDRERRYDTAGAMAADIRRHLRDEPITARPSTTLYQMRKFARRHRAVVVGATTTVIALMLGLVGTSFFLVRSVRNEHETEARARDLQHVVSAQRELQAVNLRTLVDSMEAHLPLVYRAQLEADGVPPPEIDERTAQFAELVGSLDLTLVVTSMLGEGVLGERVTDAGRLLGDQPEARAAVLHTVGVTARRHGLAEFALGLFRSAHTLNLERLGSHAPETLAARYEVVHTFAVLGRFVDALELAEGLVEAQQAAGADRDEAAESMIGLVRPLIRCGRVDDADAYAGAALAHYEATRPGRSRRIRVALLEQARVRIAQGRFDDAVDILARVEAETDLASMPSLWWVWSDLRAQAHVAAGESTDAEALLRASFDGRRNRSGESFHQTIASAVRLATLLIDLERLGEADELLKRSLVFAGAAVEPRADIIAEILRRRAEIARAGDRDADARDLLEEARSTLDDDGRSTREVDEMLREG